MIKCSVDNCNNFVSAKKYCTVCYARNYRHGSPTVVLRKQRRTLSAPKICLKETYADIDLGNGEFAIIDLDDVKAVSGKLWHKSKTTGYVHWRKISLHDFILGPAPKGKVIDHIDRNKLNCQKSNLRYATQRENNLNKAQSDNAKHYNYHKASNKWRLHVAISNQHLHLGLVQTESEAKQLAKRIADLKAVSKTANHFLSAWKTMRTEKADTIKADE
jgi:hypothetical protein